jgi:hypothetical protein
VAYKLANFFLVAMLQHYLLRLTLQKFGTNDEEAQLTL